jgi:hypothetical protein
MFNSRRPDPADLPTTRQLLRATAIAAISAGAILATVVLPSEYAIDPTGIGRTLGLTQMGEIKMQLAKEAAADSATNAAANQQLVSAPVPVSAGQTAPAEDGLTRSDVTTVTLAPGEGAEIKVAMANGARLDFAWSVEGGHVNFDTHADAPGISYHGYGKGKESTGENGTLVAAFDGNHDWFWRNRSGEPSP